jgi:hypothetical protein
MGASPGTPPVIPGGSETRFESNGSTAAILPFRRGSTLDSDETAARGDTSDEEEIAERALFDWATDGKTKRDLKPDEAAEPAERRTFRPGSVEHTTLEAIRRYGSGGRKGSKGGSARKKRH